MARRRSLLLFLGALAVALTAVSLAWACAPSGGGLHLDPYKGVAGTTVTASGHNFMPNDQVTIHWDSVNGPVLKTIPGPSFTTQIVIPVAEPGVHYVVTTSSTGTAAAAFEVMAPPATGGGGPSGSPGASYRQPAVAPGPTPAGGRTFNGTSRGELIVGTRYADVINCGGGNDRVRGGGGNDVINCGSGRDRVSGGSGNDRITGGTGNDRLNGGSGNDRLTGGRGNDRIAGGTGRDRLFGNRGRDVLFRDGTDRLSGGPGKDRSIRVNLAGSAAGGLGW